MTDLVLQQHGGSTLLDGAFDFVCRVFPFRAVRRQPGKLSGAVSGRRASEDTFQKPLCNEIRKSPVGSRRVGIRVRSEREMSRRVVARRARNILPSPKQLHDCE